MTDSVNFYNAHVIDLRSADDIKKNLQAIGLSQSCISAYRDRLLNYSIKLKNVDSGSAVLLESCMKGLDGTVVMNNGAGHSVPGQSDVIVSCSRYTIYRLVQRLREKPLNLDQLSREIEESLPVNNLNIAWGRRALDFANKTYVMGILNCTPDSFYPDSRARTLGSAEEKALKMIADGVDIIDVGGESSRPGSESVGTSEELKRVIPVIKMIREKSEVLISIDTRKHEVAEQAIEAGADIVNDISGLKQNTALAELIAEKGVPVIIMHIRGIPKDMQDKPFYEDTVSDILKEIKSAVAFAQNCGISRKKIIVDPGIGFGKRVEDNLRIIQQLASLNSLNLPILIGISRKSFIAEIIKQPVENRLTGTITANTLAILNGTNIIRVHDVPDALEMVQIIDAVRRVNY
jgi:dihydropteroate synthase